jgi:hypothetical protein
MVRRLGAMHPKAERKESKHRLAEIVYSPATALAESGFHIVEIARRSM